MDMDDELPEIMQKKLDAFDISLHNIELTLKPFLKVPINDIREKIDDPLENAKLDLMTTYAINSLFWAYLTTQGINSKQHPVKNELKRIKEYMVKLKAAEDKKKMARVDTHAAKRFIRNALWEGPKPSDGGSSSTTPDTPSTSASNTVGDHTEEPREHKKRKHKDKSGEDSEKKKKKKKKKKIKQE